ncbi:MAG: hypothetical protein AAGK01_08965 [Pseudomonadota bacterium]
MIRRRIFAALLLFGVAIGSALFWDDGEIRWLTIGVNIACATAGLFFLHYRWRSKERRPFPPTQANDVFN